MRGIHLNDIPVDLFVKYFTKDNTTTINYDPIIRQLLVNIYKFDIDLDGPFYYKSVFDFNHSKSEILRYFQDIKEFSEIDDIVEDTFFQESSSVGMIYYNDILELSIPYQYRLEKIDPPDNKEYHFITVTFKEDKTEILSILDSRNLEDLSISGILTFDPVNNRFEITYNNDVIAYLYENEEFIIYKEDPNGKIIYMNEFGNETTESSLESSLIRHNNAIRLGFNGIRDVESHINLNFNNKCLGLVDNRTSKGTETLYFAYYEKYERTLKYTRVDPTTIVDSYEVLYFDRALLKKIPISETYTETITNTFTSRLLDFSSLTRIKTTKRGDTYESILENGLVQPDKNINILADVYKDVVIFQNKTYNINYNNETRVIRGIGEIVSFDNSDYIKIPVIENSIIYQDPRNENSFITKQVEIRNNKKYININEKYYDVVDTLYPYILYPIKIEKVFVETYLGKITNVTVPKKKFKMGAISLASPAVFLSNEITPSVKYYIKDIYDSSIGIEIEEEYKRVNPSANYNFFEFLKYNHVYNNSGSILLENGKKIERSSAEEITTELSITTLKSLFSFNHFIENGYLQSRGAIVPDNVFKLAKNEMIKKMALEFIEKKYNDFLIIDSGLFDIDVLLKMRIYAESFQEILRNDYENFSKQKSSRKTIHNLSDVTPIIILSKTDDEDMPLIKDYQDYSPNLSELSLFERLLNYEKFPTNKSYREHELKRLQRKELYNDYDTPIKVLDDFNIPILYPTQYNYNMEEFKKIFISDLINNFYKFNNYTDVMKKGTTFINNEFTKNYKDFYKNKLSILADPAFPIDLGVSEKMVYSTEDSSLEDVIEKVLNSDWRVL